jgi:hypothetical protein
LQNYNATAQYNEIIPELVGLDFLVSTVTD